MTDDQTGTTTSGEPSGGGTSSEAHYEDVSARGLEAADEEAMLAAQTECTFIWANREGWPVGVIMSFIWRRGRFWLTASGQRARIAAVRRDPRVCIVVTSAGDGHRWSRRAAINQRGRGCRWAPWVAISRPPERHRRHRPAFRRPRILGSGMGRILLRNATIF